MPNDALALNEKDNVATAIRGLEAGEAVEVAVGNRTRLITIIQPVPYGHKFAIVDIQAGQDVIKYDEVIGLATKSIPVGTHTHVHNIESKRGRGDWCAKEDGI